MADAAEQHAPEFTPGHLERAYIVQYLSGIGHTLESVKQLPEHAAHEIMVAASLYASTHLAEVETRAHLVEEIHGGGPAI